MKSKTQNRSRTAAKPFPPPLSKRLVNKYALQKQVGRPMLFWEMARLWDWTELAKTESGDTSKAAFLSQMSRLYDHLTDESISRNSRSMVLVAQVTTPTQREFLRLCDKYGYDTGGDETEVPDED